MARPSEWIDSIRDARERHRERHRSSGFQFAVADRIAYLDASAWDQVTADASVFLSRGYREVLEKHGPEDLLPAYALVYSDEKPVAAVATQSVEFTALQMRGGVTVACAGGDCGRP